MTRQLYIYAVIGTISSGLHFTVAASYIHLVNGSLIQSNLTGFIISFLWSYPAHSKFVFNSDISFIKMYKYLVVQLIALSSALVLSNLGYVQNLYAKTFLVVIFLPMCSFVIHKFWTFAEFE